MSSTSSSSKNHLKHILVTGANDGIGLALVKQLTKDYDDVKVFLGARSQVKGEKAIEAVKEHYGGSSSDDKVELMLIDVNSQETITQAAQNLRERGIKLYGLVNNAGIGISTSGNSQDIINTNYYGTKRVTETFLPLLEDDGGRIVMTGSGAGPMTVRNMPSELQKLFVHPNSSVMLELETKMSNGELEEYDKMKGYGISKAMMHMYSGVIAKEYCTTDDKKVYGCYCVSPGYVDTKMTAMHKGGMPVEEGTKSLRYCLFEATKEQNGWYFGSDAKRSPIHVTRDPGTPEFDGLYPF